jgi:anti-anti-sigma factor
MIVFDPSGVPFAQGLPALSIFVSRTEPRASVALLGEIDTSVTEHLVDAIAFAGAADGVTDIEVDVSGVTFIDAVGLRGLLQAGVALSAHGRRFVLSMADDGPVARLLALTQIDLEAVPPRHR